MNSLVMAATNCRLDRTDPLSEKAILMKVLQLLNAVMILFHHLINYIQISDSWAVRDESGGGCGGCVAGGKKGGGGGWAGVVVAAGLAWKNG